LPYRFEASVLLADTVLEAVTPLLGVHVALEPLPPPVVHDVPFAVFDAGFTPAWAEVLEFALVLLDAEVDDDALLWPGAFAEFPLEPPFPLPARAEAVNAVRAIASIIVPTTPVKRLIISFAPHIRTTFPQGLSRFETRK
jgi:hypothetical protein